ncbi:MAG: DegT/DnrJ/EryC1/StrS family aminotransferase [Patescibacteria group bacterium]
MIKLIKSSFYNEEKTKKDLAEFILRADIFSMGEQCKEFEKRFSEKQRRKFAVFVNSGSSANLILIQSLLNLGILKKGDKVGFSALTWATNVMPIIQLGLIPIPIDCEKETLNVSVNTLEKKIGDIDALFITNVLGLSDRIGEIRNLCDEKNIPFFEDNCEALGSRAEGRLLGNFGSASTFSFFVGHHISTIEGGMVCTDDEAIYEMLTMVRAHGWDRNLSETSQKKLRQKHAVDDFFAKYTFYDLGYNVRPTEIQGFIGNVQIGYWDEIVEKRHKNFKIFESIVNGNNDFLPFSTLHMELVSNFAMPVICGDIDIFNKYKNRFEVNDIEVRPIIAGDMTKQVFFNKYAKGDKCVNAAFAHAHGFYFGNNPELTNEEIGLLTELLKK